MLLGHCYEFGSQHLCAKPRIRKRLVIPYLTESEVLSDLGAMLGSSHEGSLDICSKSYKQIGKSTPNSLPTGKFSLTLSHIQRQYLNSLENLPKLFLETLSLCRSFCCCFLFSLKLIQSSKINCVRFLHFNFVILYFWPFPFQKATSYFQQNVVRCLPSTQDRVGHLWHSYLLSLLSLLLSVDPLSGFTTLQVSATASF